MLRRALGFVVGLVVRAWLATLRIVVELDPALAEEDRAWALALFHGQQLALLGWKRRRRTVALVSRSRDGDIEAGALARVGVWAERGSSSRGGASGLRRIVRRMREGLDVAFAVDGPKGPRGVVRSDGGRAGVALAARLGRGAVVPMGAACASAWVLRSWDRFELPRPWSRVAVVLGPPIGPNDASPTAIGDAINAARARAEGLLRG